MTNYLNVDSKLGVDKFNVNEGNPHIVLDESHATKQDIDRLIRACPAGLYRYGDDGKLQFDYAGCLECGTCRVLGLGNIVKSWNWPDGTFGVMYRVG